MEQVVNLLLEAGIDASTIAPNTGTARDIAVVQDAKHIIELLDARTAVSRQVVTTFIGTLQTTPHPVHSFIQLTPHPAAMSCTCVRSGQGRGEHVSKAPGEGRNGGHAPWREGGERAGAQPHVLAHPAQKPAPQSWGYALLARTLGVSVVTSEHTTRHAETSLNRYKRTSVVDRRVVEQTPARRFVVLTTPDTHAARNLARYSSSCLQHTRSARTLPYA